MSRKIKVGLKYCGHCNIHLNGPEVIRAVQLEAPEFEFTGWDDPQKEILLVIDACPSACATRPPFDGPVICLTGIPQQGEIEENNRWAAAQILTRLRAARQESA